MAETYEEYEETHHVTRKSVTTFKIEETSSSTTTKTITTPAKLYGKDVGAYDDIDVDELLAQLSPEEITMLAKEVDPDDSFLPPSQRTNYECDKAPTGPLDRKKLIDHINKQALETPDRPELEPFVPGVVRGKKWIPPPQAAKLQAADEQIAIDLGDEYEQALSDATQEEIIDLAAILGFHSMMNQDQYHASLLNKGQPVGLGWDGITKSAIPKIFPAEAPNTTDPEETIQRIKSDDSKLVEVNLNNIKTISDEQFDKLFEALKSNTHLEVLSLTNVGLTDRTALMLAAALEQNHALRVLNVETNFISPTVIVTLVKSLLTQMTIEEFRASNQRSQVFGNKIEMEITELVEKNTTLLRLGLHLEFNDARHRVAAHLQRNIDRIRVDKRDGRSSRGSYYRPIRIDEELAEMSDVEEEPEEEEEEPEVEVPPADYDVEEDPDNVVIRPPPSDDEDITPGTSDPEQVSSPKPPRRPHATQPTGPPETTRGNLRDENYLREFTYQRYLRAFTSILGDTVWLRGH